MYPEGGQFQETFLPRNVFWRWTIQETLFPIHVSWRWTIPGEIILPEHISHNQNAPVFLLKDLKRTDPHKMGQLSKQGAIVKSWKQRHFVVNPDYSVFYYETEEVSNTIATENVCMESKRFGENFDNNGNSFCLKNLRTVKVLIKP